MPVREGPRRRARRVAAAIPGRLRGRSTHRVTALDISVTGCLLRTSQRLDVGSIQELELELDGGTLTTRARVREVSLDGGARADAPRYLAGLEFLGLGARQQALLRGFLDTELGRRDGVSDR